MNHLDMMTTLVDAARQMPETRHLRVAIKTAEKRIEVLRERKRRRDGNRYIRRALACCLECREALCECNCWDEKRNCWLHSQLPGQPLPKVIPAYFEVVNN